MLRLVRALAAGLLIWAACCAPAFAGSMTLMGLGKGYVAGGGGGGPTPVFAWATQGVAASSTTTVTTSKSSNTITAGDLLVAVLALTDNSGTNHFVVCPTGFNHATSWSPNYDTNTNFAECWKIAAAGDTGGAFAFTWTTNITQSGQWTLMDFTGANATTPLEANAEAGNSSVGPTVTSLGSNRLLISCSAMAGSSVTVTTQPSGMTNLFTAASGALIRTQCASLSMPTAAASGSKTWTWSAGNPAQTFNSVIAP